MTTEDDFQGALNANPNDHHTRMVFADWLEERGDPRAEGYRALGTLRRVPTWAFNQPSSTEPWYLWVGEGLVDGASAVWFKKVEKVMRGAALPADWCRRIYLNAPKDERKKWNYGAGWFGYATTRRAAEDAAAIAFAALPPNRRTKLLAAPLPEDKPPPKKSKKAARKKPTARKPKGKK